MPFYTIKRYHTLVPTKRPVWHFGREIVFEAVTDADAIEFAEERHPSDLGELGGLLLLIGHDGAQIWHKKL